MNLVCEHNNNNNVLCGYWYWKINGFHRFRKSYKKIQRFKKKAREGMRYKKRIIERKNNRNKNNIKKPNLLAAMK